MNFSPRKTAFRSLITLLNEGIWCPLLKYKSTRNKLFIWEPSYETSTRPNGYPEKKNNYYF